MRWPRRGGCRGCGHTTQAAGCTCQREGCVCRTGRQARFDAAAAALDPRDRQWLEANRPQITEALHAGDDTRLDGTRLDSSRLDDLAAEVDLTQLRRILSQVAESEDPEAMARFLEALLPPPEAGSPSE